MFFESVPRLVWAVSRTVRVRLNAWKINVPNISFFFPSFLLAASSKGEQQSKLPVILQNPFIFCLKGFVRKMSLSSGRRYYCLQTAIKNVGAKQSSRKPLMALCFNFGEGDISADEWCFLRWFSKNGTINQSWDGRLWRYSNKDLLRKGYYSLMKLITAGFFWPYIKARINGKL